MTDLTDDRIDQLVREAAPAAKLGTDEQITALLDDLTVDVTSVRPAPVRLGTTRIRSRWRRALVAPVAAGVVLLTAAAGFAVWYDSGSADFERALTQYTAQVALPPGTDRAAYIGQVRGQGRELRAEVSDLGVQSMVGHYAVCAWLTAWDRRHAAGDSVAEAEAIVGLRRAIGAPVMKATDGGGVIDNLDQVAAAAANGDRSRVARELIGNCGELPLDGVR
ncbi:MAG TPA: hypothetical protein VF755_05260 [Catenuloplanes sp.]|jgi:hypothetical protein